MDAGLALEYIASIEHKNRISDPQIPRRARIERELALLAASDARSGRGLLPRLVLALGRIGGRFATPRTTAGQA